MSAVELIELAARHGVTVRLAGEKVKLLPTAKVTPELVATLRPHRDEIREHLRRQRALPSDPDPAARTCAWCGRDLDADRQRLCRACTDPGVTPSAPPPERPRRTAKPWEPPGAVAPPRACARCSGGLAPGDPDGGPCSSCRWNAGHLPRAEATP